MKPLIFVSAWKFLLRVLNFAKISGEKVLCYHGPLIYEAKCLKSSTAKEKQIKYLIHYAGWNKKYGGFDSEPVEFVNRLKYLMYLLFCSWDEWVPESRVLKFNESNVQKQREVQRAHSNQQPAHRNKKTSTGAKAQGRRSEGGREKDTDSRASTPVGPAERPLGRISKTPVGTPTPSSSHEGFSERKKRRYRYSFMFITH